MSPAAAGPPVLAAGALVWRRGERGVEALLVERTQHRDLSLPKGKLDPGESLPECAAREIEEETGCAVTLGAPLGTSEYRLPDGRDKVVYYWQAPLGDAGPGPFEPNDEIMALHWLPLDEARRRVSYEHDAAIIARFEERLARGQEQTFPIVALRHGKAADPYSFDGDDAARPLTPRGERQSASIARGIAAFGPERILSSDALRCLQTVEPLEAVLGVEAKALHELSQEWPVGQREEIERRIAKAVRKRRGTVLCSHAPVIGDIVSAVVHVPDAAETERTHRASMLHTAEFTVLHVSAGAEPSLIALETHGPPAD